MMKISEVWVLVEEVQSLSHKEKDDLSIEQVSGAILNR